MSFYIVTLLARINTRIQAFLRQGFGIPSEYENIFQKKYTHAGSLVNTTLPACCICHFTLQYLQSSAQKHQNAEDFCSIIIEILKQYYPTFLIHKTKHPQRNRILIHILCVIFHYISLVCR